MTMPQPFNIGDRVVRSAAFLRSTGQFTGHAPYLRGTVSGWEGNEHFLVVEVEWDDDTVSQILSPNLVHENRIHLEAP